MTFLLAVLGAYTGTSAWLDQRRISVRVTPAPYPAATQTELIEAALVNRSQRSVVLTSGPVLLDGEDVGDVTVLRTELPLGSRFLIRKTSSTAPGRCRSPLSLAQARPPPSPGTQPASGRAISSDAAWTCHSTTARTRGAAPAAPAADVTRAPPGSRRHQDQPRDGGPAPLGLGASAQLAQHGRNRAQQQGHGAPGHRGASEGVTTRHDLDSRSAAPVRVVSRPISGPRTRFPVDVLRRGRYSWALETRDDTFTGEFVSRVDLVSIEECQEDPLSGFGGP